MIGGNVSREQAIGKLSNDNKELATTGYYSRRVHNNKNTLLVLMICGALIDTTKLFYQSKAIENDLEARYGTEYLLWRDVAIDDIPLSEALKTHHCNSRNL